MERERKKTIILLIIALLIVSGVTGVLLYVFRDTTPPVITIITPTTDVYSDQELTLKISTQDDSEVTKIWYNWDGINVTYTSPVAVTFNYGFNEVQVWAQDKRDNLGYTSMIFSVSDRNFTTLWNTSVLTSLSSNSNQIELPLTSEGTYLFSVYWGDGTSDLITGYDNLSRLHTYDSEGEYLVNITGTLIGWNFRDMHDSKKLIEIKNWGDLRLGNSGGYFYDCKNLNITAEDNLDLTGTYNMEYAFYSCEKIREIPNLNNWDVSNVVAMKGMFLYSSNFNQSIGDWDVSNVADMSYMFMSAKMFNQDIGGWDVSNVTDMTCMFTSCDVFDQDIGDWDVSNVAVMEKMFMSAIKFNQDIGDWDVSNVINMESMFYHAFAFNQDIGNWDVSNVTSMFYMFCNADAFNQDIGDWDVSNVNEMQYMFYGSDAFDQDIGDWDVSNVTDMTSMFSWISLSIANYDALLIGWSQLNLQNGVIFGGGNSHCSSGAAADARQYIRNTFGWTITDGDS